MSDSSVLEVGGHLCCLELEYSSGFPWHTQPSVTSVTHVPTGREHLDRQSCAAPLTLYTTGGTSDPYASSTRQVLGATVAGIPNPRFSFRSAQFFLLSDSHQKGRDSSMEIEAVDKSCSHSASTLRQSRLLESFIMGLQCPQEWSSGWHFNAKFLAFIKGQKQPDEIRY